MMTSILEEGWESERFRGSLRTHSKQVLGALAEVPTALALCFLLTRAISSVPLISAHCAKDQTFRMIEGDRVAPTSPFPPEEAPSWSLGYGREPLAGVFWVGKTAELEITGKVWWEGQEEGARGGRCLHPRGPSGATSRSGCGRRSGKHGQGPQCTQGRRAGPRGGSRGLERKPSPPSRKQTLQPFPGV